MDDPEVGKTIHRLHGDHIKNEDARETHRKKLRYLSQKLVERRPEMMIMFYKGKDFHAIAPGYIHVPMNFAPDELKNYLNEHLEIHRMKSAKFVDQYEQFEALEKELCEMLSINGIERTAENDILQMDSLLLGIKHLKKFIKSNPELLFPLVRITSLSKKILMSENYRIHADFVLEIPTNFKNDELEEFIKNAQEELMLAV